MLLQNLILILTFLSVAGLLWWGGLWSSFISLGNILLAGLVATAFFEPVADQLEYGGGASTMSFAYLCDIVALWLVFFLAALLIRTLTDSFSSVRLRFDTVTEMVGRSVISLLGAGLFVCFAHFTLITAPLPTYEGLRRPGAVSPGQLWVSLARGLSQGALAEAREAPLIQPYRAEHLRIQGEGDLRVFDPRDTFRHKYVTRRARFSQQKVARVIRGGGG